MKEFAPSLPPRVATPLDVSRLRNGSDGLAWIDAFDSLWPLALSSAQAASKGTLRRDEVEDAAAEALFRVATTIARGDRVEDVHALISTAAWRQSVSYLRARRAAKRCGSFTDIDGIEPASDVCVDPYSQWCSLDMLGVKKLIDSVLAIVDRQTRSLIAAKLLEGQTLSQMSARNRMPVGTIVSKLNRGLLRIRKRLSSQPHLRRELLALLH